MKSFALPLLLVRLKNKYVISKYNSMLWYVWTLSELLCGQDFSHFTFASTFENFKSWLCEKLALFEPIS